MTRAQHTPGPWLANPSSPYEGSECYWIVTEDLRTGIACAYGPQRDAQGANARLIAAAPELLDALKSVQQELGRFVSGCLTTDESLALRSLSRQIEAAVDKAEPVSPATAA